MKKYLIQKTIEAEPMFQYEAEARLGREIDNNTKEDAGFLTCNMDNLQFDWVPESKFEGRAFDAPDERMFYLYDKLAEWQTFFRNYTKSKARISQDERLQIYLINRHLKAVSTALGKVLNINTLSKVKE